MKIAITLCLLVAFCSVNAKPLDILTDILVGVQNLTKQVQGIIKGLESDRSFIERNIISQIEYNYWIPQRQRLIDYINSTIDAIRKETEAAKAEGKNASQPCYDAASNSLKNISNLASSDVQRRCVVAARSSIKWSFWFVDNLIPTGRALILKLDNIFSNCYSNDIFEMQRCVAFKLVTANIAVKNLQDKANSVYLTAGLTSNNIVLQGNNCLYNVYLSVMSQVTEVRFAATKCLKGILMPMSNYRLQRPTRLPSTTASTTAESYPTRRTSQSK